MFFEVNKYTPEELKTFWQNFSKLTNHYTSNERWNEIVPKDDEFSDYLSLTFDNVLFEGHDKTFKSEEEMKTLSPFFLASMSVILAKKTIFDYGVKQVLPFYEFETFYQTTRLTSIFERTQEFSELKDDYKKCQEVLLTAFPEEEITLWHLLTDPELSEKLSGLFDDKDFGFSLIELFTNMLAFDFVRNYLKLPNERRELNNVPIGNEEGECEQPDYDCVETYDEGRVDEYGPYNCADCGN